MHTYPVHRARGQRHAAGFRRVPRPHGRWLRARAPNRCQAAEVRLHETQPGWRHELGRSATLCSTSWVRPAASSVPQRHEHRGPALQPWAMGCQQHRLSGHKLRQRRALGCATIPGCGAGPKLCQRQRWPRPWRPAFGRGRPTRRQTGHGWLEPSVPRPPSTRLHLVQRQRWHRVAGERDSDTDDERSSGCRSSRRRRIFQQPDSGQHHREAQRGSSQFALD